MTVKAWTPEQADAAASALEPALTAARNYVAGVRIRADSLTASGAVSEEVGAQLALGLEGARRQLEQATEIVAELRRAAPIVAAVEL
ncbi:MAG: hypothetical protein QM611_07950 [Microbacterium sp.]|uniref:hypothetical protein n=1 Tax=Microbacterium sp. TaxID=51671 RepID=UPI0039E361A3